MPAIRVSASDLLRAQHERAVNESRALFNLDGREYVRGIGFQPYPTAEEVYNRSNTAIVEDDEFEDLGLRDFVIANQRAGRHRYMRWREAINPNQRGLLTRGLETWDPVEERSTILETSLAYTASVGMAAFEEIVLLRRRVCGLLSSLVMSLLTVSSRWIPWSLFIVRLRWRGSVWRGLMTISTMRSGVSGG